MFRKLNEFHPILVTCSFADAASARAAAKELLEAKLAACVSLFSNFDSLYHWHDITER
ncbi:MAG: hypothetical protein B9S37_06655 [Verrucomicrobiia bacterium Tous-C3TDCM]|nr:MAG: hypothetical protein B9S37_06655 [Verrucomicrobiae bacterium Tous-C3TDCM]PAZ03905.1 MAG: hypothetical protein CAK88_13335 [Verrucomicrobiae bacterium AMD-G2]